MNNDIETLNHINFVTFKTYSLAPRTFYSPAANTNVG